ncbi:hypothetical protein [Neisseria sp. Ec49-e6-T10]|uniref:hypothetical protein n=1 Tax=Neisseria sp. Ec49-e6-T10 TaxID=3140744 RepID=UPI003EC0DF61
MNDLVSTVDFDADFIKEFSFGDSTIQLESLSVSVNTEEFRFALQTPKYSVKYPNVSATITIPATKFKWVGRYNQEQKDNDLCRLEFLPNKEVHLIIYNSMIYKFKLNITSSIMLFN